MSIKEQILQDIKIAMKQKDEFRRDSLRTLHSVLKQVEIDQRVELSDEIVLGILQKEIKKRNDAKDIYLQGGREDLAQKESMEAGLIAVYLPKQLNDDELKLKLQDIKMQLGASSIKDLGNFMKVAKEQIGASADARRISEIAKAILA
ncbi:GatB/YqeY domain-containing protein [Campylobacter majalis]|uniref:GatB/YqeY domain-containing protein n=1 Tax=Campylobacter majalis TaxID=2790656 RepID=UPI003D685514